MRNALLIFVSFYRSAEILVMLCNALARGLIISWIPKPKPAEKKEDRAIDSSRKAAAKKQEKANIIQSFSVDPSGLPDIKAALEVQTPDFFVVPFVLLSYIAITINSIVEIFEKKKKATFFYSFCHHRSPPDEHWSSLPTWS